MNVEVNDNGYVEGAFFTEVKAVRINKRAVGEYVFIVFGQDGSEEHFEIKTVSSKKHSIFVKHNRTDVM